MSLEGFCSSENFAVVIFYSMLDLESITFLIISRFFIEKFVDLKQNIDHVLKKLAPQAKFFIILWNDQK